MSFTATFIRQTITLKVKDDFLIERRNWLVHNDIANDMLKVKDGLFIFGIKVVNGEITDYMPIDNAEHNLPQIT